MTCDDYQIAFGQLGAGASSGAPAAEVDAHLAACAACAAYASLSRKVNGSMMNTLSLSPPPLDLDAMRAHVTKFRRQASRTLMIWPVAFGAFFLVSLLLGPGRATVLGAVVGAAVGAGVSYAILALWTRRYIASLTALEAKSGNELVAGMRAELDRRVRTEREGWWVLPILLVLFHWRFVGWALPTQPYIVAFELCFLALFPLGIVRHRRAKRERALLG
jgi:hypothetical protein